MKYAIFTKWKDGFLYPNVNLLNSFIDIKDIQDKKSRELAINNIKDAYILFEDKKKWIKTIKEFDEKYIILFEL